MIRKLRIKIVLVIVLVAAVMLGVIFGMSYTMTRQDLRAQSISMMQAIAANPFEPLPPGQSRQVRLPYFVLRTDAFGNLVAIGSTDYDLTDRSFLRAVAAAASASEADIGEIPAYHLRFCRVDGSVIFADISSEQQTLQGLVRSSLLIGGGSLLALIGLAILLARWAVRPVETAWRQQKQFVADASHELKTPLTVILTNTELLQSPDYDEAQKQQFTDGIRTMAQQMRALVERLLELARAENARPQAAFAPVCLSEVAETSALLFEAALYERGLTLETQVEPELTVSGDERQLGQLVEILLDNARKYASGGTVRLQLQRSGRHSCHLSLENEGPALSPQQLQEIFKRFTRADPVWGSPSRRRSYRRITGRSGPRAGTGATRSTWSCRCGPAAKNTKKRVKRVYDFVQSDKGPCIAKRRKNWYIIIDIKQQRRYRHEHTAFTVYY